MIAVESPTVWPSIRITGKVICSPRVSASAIGMCVPSSGARRTWSIPLWSRAQRTFSL
jgi:hypothetical protein